MTEHGFILDKLISDPELEITVSPLPNNTPTQPADTTTPVGSILGPDGRILRVVLADTPTPTYRPGGYL